MLLTDGEIDEIDRLLEIASLIRANEIGHARAYRVGTAFGTSGDLRRLDAFTVGLIETLARRLEDGRLRLDLLLYLLKLHEHGPGQTARRAFRELRAVAAAPDCAAYVAGGRLHAMRILAGRSPEVGHFCRLLVDELDQD